MPKPQRWFSSDHHFNHDAIRRYSERPFATVEEMDVEMMSRWNAAVAPNDLVYYLGDLAFAPKDATRALLNQMHGRIYYVRGNHDRQMKGPSWDRFEWIKDYFDLKVDEQHIVLCHYAFETWNRSHHGSWHLHGHSHGSFDASATQPSRPP
ncbi:hypothetical protein LCGC14_1078240 [marine sediment metagenome]|uniref:Calcineurin-like phosphoesterase domain-containing protein n=1 Tax=marine sediment metagenome TaxID=412755 RepID=A0A0F9QLV5_9ZZZZ